MRPTNLAAAAAKLQHDVKDLKAHWEIAREQWSDVVQREFEARRLEPLERSVDGALRGIDELHAVLQRMIREVGPRE